MDPTPTVRFCDCPNGCIVIQFGYVSIHLSRASFRTFVHRLAHASRALEAHAEPAES